jgi:anti-sigma regulatory factor (Ser/Thr protein kinase)
MEDLSLHILDIVENSVDAGATKIDIIIKESHAEDLLTLSIRDNGKGMDAETLERVIDPFFTTKTTRRFGLGIPLLKQSAEECRGSFGIESSPGVGTFITATMQLSHIDRKPLGDTGTTVMVLIAGHPDIDFSLTYLKNSFRYEFDSKALKDMLSEVPINLPHVLSLIRDEINGAIQGGDENVAGKAVSEAGKT